MYILLKTSAVGAFLFWLLPFLSYGQDLSYSFPLKRNNVQEAFMYEDAHGYALFVHEFVGNDYFYFLDREGKVVGSHKMQYKQLHGYTSDQKSFVVYFTSIENRMSALIFDKASGTPTVERMQRAELQAKDKEFLTLTHSDKLYRIYLNEQLYKLSLYAYEGIVQKHVVTIPVSPAIMKIRNQEFRYIPYRQKIDMDDLKFERHLYWQGDSLIFTTSDKEKISLISLHLKTNGISSRTIPVPQTDDVTELLVGDKLIIRFMKRHLVHRDFEDSLVLQIFDTRQNFKCIKTLAAYSESGIKWKSKLYLSSEGDTVENKWKQEERDELVLSNLRQGFVHLRCDDDKQFTMTLGVRTYVNKFVTRQMVGMNQNGTTNTYDAHVPTPGPIHSFQTCLSEDFEPMRCNQITNAYEKALQRVYRVHPDSGKKRRREEWELTSIGDFRLITFNDHVYLTYVDKKNDLFMVERFDEK